MHNRTLGILGMAALALSGCGGKDAGKAELVLQGNVDVRQVSLAFEDSASHRCGRRKVTA